MSGFVKALLGVIAIVLLIGVLASLFTVEQREQALVGGPVIEPQRAGQPFGQPSVHLIRR